MFNERNSQAGSRHLRQRAAAFALLAWIVLASPPFAQAQAPSVKEYSDFNGLEFQITPADGGATQTFTLTPTGTFTAPGGITAPTASIVLGGQATGSQTILYPNGQAVFGGNVGIGIPNPSQALDVDGNVQFQGSRLLTGLDGDNNFWIANNAGSEPNNVSYGYETDGSGNVTKLFAATEGIARLYVDDSGNVGIGTSAPSQALEVNGNIQLDGYRLGTGVDDDDNFWIKNSIGSEPNSDAWGYETDGSGNVTALLAATEGAVRFYVNSAGQVGIATTDPNYTVQVNGTVYASGGAGALSDRRHKKDIKPFDQDALAIVEQLKPVTYEWKQPVDDGMRGEQIGFIAQDVEPLLPDAVMTARDKDRTLGLKYDALIPVLTKAVQQLKAANDNQMAEIKQLRMENRALRMKLDADNDNEAAEIAALKTDVTQLRAAGSESTR